MLRTALIVLNRYGSVNAIGAKMLEADVQKREPVLQGIDERITRVGSGRSQGWTLYLNGEPVAYYDRNPLLFNQTFHVDASSRGRELGFHSVDTEDPYHEMTRQWLQTIRPPQADCTWIMTPKGWMPPPRLDRFVAALPVSFWRRAYSRLYSFMQRLFTLGA